MLRLIWGGAYFQESAANLTNSDLSKGAFVSAGGSWNLIALTDLRVCLGEFIEYDHGPVNPAWEVGS